MGLCDAAVGALRPAGSAGSTVSRPVCWTWTRSVAVVLEAVWQGVVELGHHRVKTRALTDS